MPKVISADLELDIAQRHLTDAERKATKCYEHVRDDRTYLADVSNPRNERSNQTIKKAQQALRKWEENLADAQSTVQECTRNVRRAQEILAKNQAIRDGTGLPQELVAQIAGRGNQYNHYR
ncbi:MAG: hypothetical protein L6R42_005129 [Xanthoria sp. 1 TBL-2021]|nr:MAG: hypothetical protein L6R42_005129 [Xanthoria sp. 1 TBL-2021]